MRLLKNKFIQVLIPTVKTINTLAFFEAMHCAFIEIKHSLLSP